MLGADLDCLIEELFEDQLGVFVFMVRSSDNDLSIFANRVDRKLHFDRMDGGFDNSLQFFE